MIAPTAIPFDPVSESYGYLWGWPSRAQSAESIADKLQRMAGLLGEVEPAYGELWPFESGSPPRPGTLGPVLAHPVEDVATVIDRRTRFDPPQRPAPVAQSGYWVLVGNHRRPSDPLYASLCVQAGAYGEQSDNAVELEVNPNGPLWGSDDFTRHVFEAGLTLWDARWGAVWHRKATGCGVKQRPRLAWTADRFASHPAPPYIWPHPYPFPFEEPPESVTAHPGLGGELQAWGG